MFQYLRKAVSGSYIQDPRNNLVRDEYRKKQLKDNLAQQIKNLQKAHVNGSHVIERNDEDALKVCMALEAIFLHEYINRGPTMDLKNMFVDGIRTAEDDTLHISFWDMVEEVTHKDVVTQLKHLVVTTEVGLCRSWVRLAMNDCLIISYLDAIVSEKDQLTRYYGPNAFLMDTELTCILKQLLQGLMEFEFRLNYNSSKLNTWDMEPLQLAGIVQCTSSGNSEPGQKGDLPTARLKDVASTKKSTKKEGKRRKPGSHNDKGTTIENSSGEPSTPTSTNNTSKDTTHSLSPKNKKIINVASLPVLSPGGFLQQKNKQENSEDSSKEETEAKHDAEETANATPKENSSNSEMSENDPVEAPVSIGNRLGGNGWSGWSSQFEQRLEEENNDGKDDSDLKTPTSVEEIKSFDSLLQLYGNNASTKNEDSETDGTLDVVDGVSNTKSNVTDLKESQSMVPSPPTSPTGDPSVNQTFEVVPMNTLLRTEHIDKKTQSSLSQLTELGLEQGLDVQQFKCKHCGKATGLIYGPYRVCYFDGGYYCFDCHDGDEYYVPARVVQNWDFRKHKVSKYNKLFLMKIEEEPLFHMDEINPALYEVVSELKELKLLRIQLQHVKEYVQTCRNDVAEDFRIRLWPREYLCDDIHQYSLLDLIQVHNGQLAHHLKKVVSQFSKHIYNCTLCREKGFICEYCHDEEIIYPFQIGIAVQCPGCLATFHRACRKDKRCPKCVRIHLRLQMHKADDIDRRLAVASKEKYEHSEIF